MIFAFVGMPGAGKSTAIGILKSKNIPVIHLRLFVEEELKKQGMEINNQNLRQMATQLREEHGRDVIIQRALNDIETANKYGNIAIDSLKSPEELELLRSKFKVVLVGVHASPATRFRRLKFRALVWDPKDREEFDWRDKKELGWGLGDLIALSDYLIINESMESELNQAVEQVLLDVKKKA